MRYIFYGNPTNFIHFALSYLFVFIFVQTFWNNFRFQCASSNFTQTNCIWLHCLRSVAQCIYFWFLSCASICPHNRWNEFDKNLSSANIVCAALNIHDLIYSRPVIFNSTVQWIKFIWNSTFIRTKWTHCEHFSSRLCGLDVVTSKGWSH